MDLFSAIDTRASCRQFLSDPIDRTVIDRILAAGVRAPSPLNAQPWRFIVITAETRKRAIHEEAERCRAWSVEQSGWKWMSKYEMDFLLQAPVLVAVVGDPKKSGMDMFQADGPVGYLLACAAAIQNILLAAHAQGLGSLWFTLYDKGHMRRILDLPEDQTPVSIVCIGKAATPLKPVPRKAVEEKAVYLNG